MKRSCRACSLTRFAAFLLVVGLSVPAAHACPVCTSETGEEVRAGLFNEDFAFNLFASALPFPIFLGIVAAIHGLPGRVPRAAGEFLATDSD